MTDIDNNIADSSQFDNATHEDTIIKVIGVGGGGNNAINHMYAQGIKNVSFVVCNTDKQALDNSIVPTKVLIGPTVTRGLGAGNVPDRARQAAEESADAINALFDDNTKMVFITAGMGGGTGTGAAPVVAKIAKERGLLTIGIVTIPFLFEGPKKILKALDGADEMSKYVDALLIINNERLTEIYSDLNFINAFGKADDTLSTAARSISDLITCKGHINLDFNDVDTTLRNGGAAIISSGYGEGDHRVTKAINDALNSPLLKNRDILGSKKLLFNLYFSPKAEREFVMEEAEELNEFMRTLDREVDVIWGVAFDETLGDKVKMTILAAGFDVTIREEENQLNDNRALRISSKRAPAKDASDRLAEEYGKEAVTRNNQAAARARYAILDPSQFDDDKVIDLFEKNPTFNRDSKFRNEIRDMARNAATAAPEEPATRRAATPDSATNIQF
mgnify:CR=1 FL=1